MSESVRFSEWEVTLWQGISEKAFVLLTKLKESGKLQEFP